MQYLCLIYEAESNQANQSEADMKAVFAGYMDFNKQARAKNRLLGGDALEPVSTATTVRIRDGQTLHTDGPFAETKEQLGGYYLIEADDLDEALEWAAKIPSAKTGCVEVRPIMILPNME